MPRGDRTPKQLREFAEHHLMYECCMLVQVAEALSQGEHTQLIKNALLESFVIHLRALIDFLWEPYNPKDDDAVASDFFYSKADWSRCQPPFPHSLEPARRRVGKEIAHLTYARMDVSAEAKQWNFLAMTKDVVSALKQFATNAHRDLLGNALRQLINTSAS